ncbi:MAG TPA: serine/threonine-protein kinase [Kofleriaceae bacterium]|nr:serine/threonine-protein kinase [Kofleriaceae bacterium]
MAEGERGSEGRPRPRPSAQSTIAGDAAGRDPGGDRARDEEGARPPVPVGTVLVGRYRLLEALGRGGMGAVYRARDTTLDADVAVKLLDPDVAGDAKRVAYFRNEVRVARKVTHPNVCRLHDLVESDGLWIITMQYVDGESLADRLRREGALPVGEVVRILRDVAAGLAAAHQAGVVHRDLKPANVLLDRQGRAIVADFGIAADTAHGAPAAVVDVAGTRGYMAPEQAAGRAVDARSDVYAFGVLAHRMLIGELPWSAPTRVQATDLTGPPAGAPADAPPALLGLIDECLAASPTERPVDGAALLDRLSTPGALAAVSGSRAGSGAESLASESLASESLAGAVDRSGLVATRDAGSGSASGSPSEPRSRSGPAPGSSSPSGSALASAFEAMAGAPLASRSDPASPAESNARSGAGSVSEEPAPAPTPTPTPTSVVSRSPSEPGASARTSSPAGAPGAAVLLRSGHRRRRIAIAVAALVVAAAAVAAWRPWARPAPPVQAVEEISIEASAAVPLVAEDAPLVDALARLVVEELDDAWQLRGRVTADRGVPPGGPGAAHLAARLWIGQDRRLVVEALLRHGGREMTTRLESASLRPLAADLAAWAARSALPAGELQPDAAELARVCARSPEAWRLWQRARRESRMQRWSQARELSGRAIALDPSFPLAPLELSFTYTGDDRALTRSAARARELAAACPTLGPDWRLVFEANQVASNGDPMAAEKVVDRVMAMPDLSDRDRLYFQTRWAYALSFNGYRSRAQPLLEWIADRWPADPAVPKLLAHSRLESDEPDAAAEALRYARQAVTYAPYDVAARADLARALLATGDAAAAAAQVRIIDRAEPAEKQGSLAGGEVDNSLIALRLELGQWAEAERDARRLLLGPVTERTQGLAALGALDLLRGGLDSGIDRMDEAYRECKDAGIGTTAAIYAWRAAWLAYQAGEWARAAELFARLEENNWRALARVLLALVEVHRGPRRDRAANLDSARAAALKLSPGTSRMVLELLVAHEAEDWKRMAALDVELRAAGVGGAPVPKYLAGDALAATGQLRAAEAAFLAVATHPRLWKEPIVSVRAWRRLGEVRERLGDRAGAVEAYRALLARWTRAPAGQADVARVRAALGRLGAAP